jgi:hypothetical protein
MKQKVKTWCVLHFLNPSPGKTLKSEDNFERTALCASCDRLCRAVLNFISSVVERAESHRCISTHYIVPNVSTRRVFNLVYLHIHPSVWIILNVPSAGTCKVLCTAGLLSLELSRRRLTVLTVAWIALCPLLALQREALGVRIRWRNKISLCKVLWFPALTEGTWSSPRLTIPAQSPSDGWDVVTPVV